MLSTRQKLLLAASVLALGFGAGIVTDKRGLRLWVELGDDVSRLETENAKLRGELDMLHRRADALRGDPRSLERSAREAGFVREGEILFELRAP